MGDVLSFTRLAHAVAFDGFGENHRGLALMLERRGIGRVHFVRIVPAAIQTPDVVVRHIGHQRLELGILAEEMFAHIRAIVRFHRLIFAVHALFHAFEQHAGLVFHEQRIPVRTPHHFNHVPACAAKVRLQLLNDLAVAAHRAIEPL